MEMSELAYILNSATERSLIILDEIGRGTSTYDGLSIAWAAAEYLCKSKQQVRTLFATHYHEMTHLEGNMKGLRNLNVDVSEENGNIVFLHKIVEGSASRSYGIHVAKLAGVPSALLNQAEVKLQELEEGASSPDFVNSAVARDRGEQREENGKQQKPETAGKASKSAQREGAPPPSQTTCMQEQQLSFFSFAPNPVTERLKNLDLMNLTPSQAFQILEELKAAAEKEDRA